MKHKAREYLTPGFQDTLEPYQHVHSNKCAHKEGSVYWCLAFSNVQSSTYYNSVIFFLYNIIEYNIII